MNGTFLLTGADVLTGLKNDSNLLKNETTQIHNAKDHGQKILQELQTHQNIVHKLKAFTR